MKSEISSLGQELVETLTKKDKTFSSAESCTGGMIASYTVGVPGASQVFVGGGVTYMTRLKYALLGVSPETVEKYTVVSEEVAGEMARGACLRFQSDFAVSTTGVAGPSGGTEKIPVGTVCIGVSSGEKTETHTFHFQGSRQDVREQATREALKLLNQYVKKTLQSK